MWFCGQEKRFPPPSSNIVNTQTKQNENTNFYGRNVYSTLERRVKKQAKIGRRRKPEPVTDSARNGGKEETLALGSTPTEQQPGEAAAVCQAHRAQLPGFHQVSVHLFGHISFLLNKCPKQPWLFSSHMSSGLSLWADDLLS